MLSIWPDHSNHLVHLHSRQVPRWIHHHRENYEPPYHQPKIPTLRSLIRPRPTSQLPSISRPSPTQWEHLQLHAGHTGQWTVHCELPRTSGPPEPTPRPEGLPGEVGAHHDEPWWRWEWGTLPHDLRDHTVVRIEIESTAVGPCLHREVAVVPSLSAPRFTRWSASATLRTQLWISASDSSGWVRCTQEDKALRSTHEEFLCIVAGCELQSLLQETP